MEQILLAYGIHREAVVTVMILCRNTKAMVHSLDGNTDFFDTVVGVLQGDTFTQYLCSV